MNKINIRSVLIGFILSLLCITANAMDSSLEQLRSLFFKWQETYQTLNNNEQKKQLDLLKGYPLYPYAQYQYINAHIDTIQPNEITLFIDQNGDMPLSSLLMRTYIETLTKQKQWQKITQLRIDNSLVSRCRYQFALLQQGVKDKALKPVSNIWLSGSDLPSACDPLFDQWSKMGGKTANLILLRLEQVLKNNNIKLARYLTEQLPGNYKTLKKNLLELYNDPKKLDNFSKNVSPSPFSQKVVLISFSRLVNTDSQLAESLLPTLVKRYKLTEHNQIDLQRSLAINYFKDSATAEQITWRNLFIAQHRDTDLIERSIRLALKKSKMDDVAYWLNLLPPADKQKDEWRYWRAVILHLDNKQQEANTLLQALTKERGFYAMYSAQKLNQAYIFDFEYPIIENTPQSAELSILNNKYSQLPVIERIEELRFLGMLAEANLEWRYYLYADIQHKNYAEIARYAYLKGWGEHSVQATIAGKLWSNWLERFPVVYQDIFGQSIKDKTIPLSYTLAIARQESALDATVQSPAGARGLMQLMPGTAKDSAKKISYTKYRLAEQLYDPDVNILLGTYYLDYVYQLFNHNRILASAAYNAGPNRVNRWLQDTEEQTDAIAFIESIPFTETRNYVKSVLVYDYIYQLVLQDKPMGILTDDELTQHYNRTNE